MGEKQVRLTPEREQEIRVWHRNTCNWTVGDMVDELLAEIDALRAELADEKSENYSNDFCESVEMMTRFRQERDQLKAESERLKKIIAKQICHEDDLGYEYTYVICLKEENQKLRDRVAKLREALHAWLIFRGSLDGDYAWFRSEHAAGLTKTALAQDDEMEKQG